MGYSLEKGILFFADITSDVTQEVTTLTWMSTENISIIADTESCCTDSKASDELRKLSFYKNIDHNYPSCFIY